MPLNQAAQRPALRTMTEKTDNGSLLQMRQRAVFMTAQPKTAHHFDAEENKG